MIGRSLWVVVGLMLAAASPVSLSGQARVVDGDTFTLGSERVRMWGIDAPEGRQTCKDAGGGDYRCGEVARDRLIGLIARRDVTCEVRDRDQYGRAVARCRVGDLDLGLEMVKGGGSASAPGPARGLGGDLRAALGVAGRGTVSRGAPTCFGGAGRERRMCDQG
jgi:endonuclease YncB( thermonuclease family)